MREGNNLVITLRERGKIVTRREGHNIWTNNGRELLVELMSFQTYSPDTFQETRRPRYMGFGIGGSRQSALGVANVPPCSTHYPGTNLQTDIECKIGVLERPARISWVVDPPSPPSGGPGSYVYDAGDVWLRQVTPSIHPLTTSILWSCAFTTTDFSATTFTAVPLSEIGLFLHGSDPNVYNNQIIAYDTFDTIQKTANFTMDVAWTVRF